MPRALTRAPAASLVRAIAREIPAIRVDPVRAQAQHQSYVEALAGLGVEITVLETDESLPDGCFIEDQAVVHDSVAFIPRVGHPARRAEADSVAAALAPHVRVVHMTGPGTLDGGDVLAVGRTLFVGRSERTDAAGVEALRAVFGPLGWRVVGVPVPPDTLHLKSVCSAIDDRTVLVARGALSAAALPGVERILWVPAEEAAAANVVAVGRDVLVAAGFPATRRIVEGLGCHVVPLEMDELRKVDGALTCLSVFF